MGAADRIRSIADRVDDPEIRGELNEIACTVESTINSYRHHVEKLIFAGVFQIGWTKRVVDDAKRELGVDA